MTPPSRVRRQPARTAATHQLVVEQDAYDDDDDDPEQGLDTDDDEEELEDAGMSPSDGDDEDEDAEDDAEEEAQPVSVTPKRSAARASGTNKGKGKAVPPPPRQEPRKKRSAAPVERGLWSDKESTIFAAAKWFMKEELEPLKGKQGTQYWVRLLAHIKSAGEEGTEDRTATTVTERKRKQAGSTRTPRGKAAVSVSNAKEEAQQESQE
ncbi:unnamed protein product [Closterium sp. NIES-53]